jgi:Domain of unknown function (DUF4114)
MYTMHKVVPCIMILALMLGLQYSVALADPVLPLRRMPICGDQDGSESPLRFLCPDFVPSAEVQMFRVPGTDPIEVHLDFVFREGSYNNELGFFRVDDLNASIDGVKPRDPGYLAAAFGRAVVVFPSGSTPYTADTTLRVNGGEILVFFLIQDTTLANLLTHNPQNEPETSPMAFFSIDSLNPDGVDHFVAFQDYAHQITQFGFEDETSGGDRDYDDVVFTTVVVPTQPPIPPGGSDEPIFNPAPILQSVTGLLFPLKGTAPGTDMQLDPYRAPIVAVFDHSLKNRHGAYGMHRCDDVVVAYTGEVGAVDPDAPWCVQHQGFAQDSAAPFYVNGHYVGSGGDANHLDYDGHAGIDYHADVGTEVYAATSGIVRYPTNIVGIRRPRGRAYKRYHVLELIPDLFPGHKIYYFHIATHPASRLTDQTVQKADATPGCPAVVTLPLPAGTHVDAGCLLALSGQAGLEGGPRLHFEIQRVVPIEQIQEEVRATLQCLDDAQQACVPVDPYGWDGDGSDPYASLIGVGNIRLWAYRPVIHRLSPTSVASGLMDLTIIGEGFEAGTTVTLVRQVAGHPDFGTFSLGTLLSQSGTQLIVRQSVAAGTYYVHVQNGNGQWSNWKKLEVH